MIRDYQNILSCNHQISVFAQALVPNTFEEVKRYPLHEDYVEIWCAQTPSVRRLPESTRSLLSEEERHRSQGLVVEEDRLNFEFAHVLVRALLGAYLGLSPRRLEFEKEANGKPFALNVDRVSFNMSHTRGAVAIALALDSEIGIDIEQIRPCDVFALAPAIMHNAELQSWRGFPKELQDRAFFELWTRKEALLKAYGCGLSVEPNSISVHWDSTEFHSIAGLEGEWNLLSLNAGAGFCAAFAYGGAPRNVRLFYFDCDRSLEFLSSIKERA